MTALPGCLGIIGGNGWLGRAFAGAVVSAGLVAPEQLLLSYHRTPPASDWLPGARWTTDCQAVVDGSEITVISVRPEQFGGVRIDARGKTIVSFMAGVPVERLVRNLHTPAVVRAMPNAALEIRRSYTPWYATPEVPPEHRRLVGEILAAGGLTDEVHSEDQIEYFTGLSGSGPAFPALLADAMIRDAVARGIDPGLAQRAAVAIVAGASQLLIGGDAPADVVETFVSYGGTTAAGIDAMLAGGLRAAVADGLAAAKARALSMADRP